MGGSSPRAWGTRFISSGRVETARFIPTGVGNTCRPDPLPTSGPVHPHGRGEHGRSNGHARGVIGSSPRAWGTRSGIPARPARRRFIPTGVGNTPLLIVPVPISAVHPHGRGEHHLARSDALFRGGSSPRAWGTLNVSHSGQNIGRFIPTGVGNTFSGIARLRQIAVHPHGRGEHTNSIPMKNKSFSWG